MRIFILLTSILLFSCSSKKEKPITQNNKDLVTELAEIFSSEQAPITKRDSLFKIYGADSKEFNEQQLIYEKNHVINEVKILNILDNLGWPKKEIIGEQGNRTICNVLQHSGYDVRVKYIPLMKKAVLNKELNASYLVRAQDRIATDNGELQIYGGQMKYYSETKSFNVWPVFDPENINERRAEIGLGTIEEHLKNRFNFEWNLEEQIKRSKEFELNKNSTSL